MPSDPAGDRLSLHGPAISIDIAVYKPFVIFSPTQFTHYHNHYWKSGVTDKFIKPSWRVEKLREGVRENEPNMDLM